MFPNRHTLFSKSYLLLLIVVLCNSFCWAQSTGNIHIAKFKDDKACAISYTFDDGLKEHYTIVTPLLNKVGFKGTFVINGSKINLDENTITDTTRMTWQDLKEMASYGQEISNHGWAHKNFGKFTLKEIKEDIDKNDSAIFANIGIRPVTFAYPNNTKTPEGVKLASENRVGTRTFQRSLGGKATTDNLEAWINKLLNDHDWGVAMTHGITYGYDHFEVPAIFGEHLQKVKEIEDKIWVGTFCKVAAYVTERDSTTLQVKQASEGHYIITTDCVLDKTLFTEPLTIVLEENGVKKIEIRQGENKLKAQILTDKIIFNVNPFGEAIDIKIKKK
jgi:peptidoglycan-N-acetylglucosamine deacetylase